MKGFNLVFWILLGTILIGIALALLIVAPIVAGNLGG